MDCQQVTEFCGRMPRRRRSNCYPEARIDYTKASLDVVSGEGPNNHLLYMQVRTTSAKLTPRNCWKNTIGLSSSKDETPTIMISGIIPRMSTAKEFYSKTFSLNSRLKMHCRELDVGYLDSWYHLHNQDSLFQKVGLHLSSVGAFGFGRFLNKAVRGS